MSLLCRTFGHSASNETLQFDSFTFQQIGECRRCGASLVHRGDRGWKEMIVRRPVAAAPAERGGC